MKKNYFTTKKRRAMRSLGALLGIVLSWGLSVTPTYAQSNAGNTITFDAQHSTMLFSDLPETQTQQQTVSCYLRHHQAPVQILNANSTAPTGNTTNSRVIAPLQSAQGTGTGFFANTSLANNMAFSSDGRVQFYTFVENYKYSCFAVIAPKGYRITEYYMDIDGTKGSGNNGAEGATIMRYTYVDGTTYQFTPCSGEVMSLSVAQSQIFNHTLSNAANILYFRIESPALNKKVCVTMNEFRLKYVIEDDLEVSLPNNDGMKVHTGYIDFGAMTQKTGANQYYFNKANVTDLQEVYIKNESGAAAGTVANNVITLSEGGTYWVEAPAKYRITEARMNFKHLQEEINTEYTNLGQNLASALGKTVKIGTGTNFIISNGGNSFSNGTQETGTTWIITKVEGSTNKYTIQNKSGLYLRLDNSSNALQVGQDSFEWTYFEEYDNGVSNTLWNWSRHQTSDHCFVYVNPSNNRHYGLQYYEGSWRAIRTNDTRDNSDRIPTPISYVQVVTTTIDHNYTASLYGTSATTSVGAEDLSSSNPTATLSATGLDNDGIKFTVTGPAAFTMNLKFMSLDPTLQSLEFGYLQNGTDAGHYISTNATNFKFNAGETIVLPIVPIAPEEGGNGDSHTVLFHNAINENRSKWYGGTGSGKKFSQYYLVDSEYEKSGTTKNVPYGRTDAARAGKTEVKFSNIETLTATGGTLTETPFDKTGADYDEIVLQDNGAEQTVYIYSADRPTYEILPADVKKYNHTAYTFYEAKLKAVDVEEEPVIEVTTIYTSTLKGDNVKAQAYNQAMNANESISILKDIALDTDHVFYGVKVTSSGSIGYLTASEIINAIKTEFSKSDYEGKVYAGDVMRTILYVDMSELKSVSGDPDTWKEIMLGTADNCLFFNPKGFSVSQDMIGGGLIAGGNGGTAVTDIVVNDQQPFFSPYEFYTSTHVARYFRTKVNDKDLPKNTTIVLPFTLLLSPDGHLRTASDQVNEKVQFFNLTTELSTPEDGVEGEVFNVGTQTLTASSAIGSPMALAFKPYHLVSEEQTATTAFMIEATGTTIPRTPDAGDAAFTNAETGMVGYGSLNGVAVPKTEEIFYFSKNYFWNSRTLPASQGDKIMLLPYRAYYKTNDGNIKALSMFGVDFNSSETATGIQDIANEKVVKGVYDLTGRRVSDDIKSLNKGVYIINGKKYFVK